MLLVKKYPKLKEAVECTHRVTLAERFRHSNFLWDKYRRDLRAYKDQIREEKAEAVAEALAEGMTEVARKMKAKGQPLEDIIDITGLPFETVKQL